MSAFPLSIAIPADLEAAFLVVLDDAKSRAGDKDGLTIADIVAVRNRAALVFVETMRGYVSMSGAEKKRLVDLALTELLRQLKPYVLDAVGAIFSVAMPWYLKWLPPVVSWFIKADAYDRLVAEIPAISQAAYDGLRFVWSKIGVDR